MSLAEEMLATMSVSDDSSIYLAEEEPHIVINESRQAIVPNELKTIAVTGDKDIETVTFDCVRYWDGHDLSTFAIYLNYVLPDGTSGTHIPKTVYTSTEDEEYYHFDWTIDGSVTKKSGKLAFAVTAVKSTENESGETVVEKQWGSIPNSDMSIVAGIGISNVPSEEESNDVLAQLSKILEEIQGNFGDWVKNNVVQSKGDSETKVMSQKVTSYELDRRSNAIVGNVSGKIVSMDDVSPVEHKMPVKLRSKNLIPYPFYDTTKTENGVTFTDNGDGTITVNGTATGNSRFDFLRNSSAEFPNATYTLSGISGGSETTYYFQMFSGDKYYNSLSNHSQTVTIDSNITMITLYVKTGATFNNLVIKPQLEVGTVATDYTPYVAEDTSFSVRSSTSNLLKMENGTHKLTTYYTMTLNDGYVRVDRSPSTVASECSSKLVRPYMSFFLPEGTYFLSRTEAEKANIGTVVFYIEVDGVDWEFNWGGGSNYRFTVDKPSLVRVGIYMYENIDQAQHGYVTAKLMLSRGAAKPFEPCGYGETVTTDISNGAELASIAPNMTITTENDGVIVEAQYNKDATRVIEKLTNAIIALGGTV